MQRLVSAGAIAALLTLVLVVAGAAAAAHPAGRVADDISAQRALLHRQVTLAQQQLALQTRQLRLTSRSVGLQRHALDVSRRTASLTADLRALARRTEVLLARDTGDIAALRRLSTKLADLSAQLIALTTDVRRHVRNLDRKVP